MAVNYVTVKGFIKDGKLEVDLPENVTEGEAEVIVPVIAADDDLALEDFQKYLNFKGIPLGEMHVGGWEDMGIEDSVEFVQALRHKAWRKHDLE
jgi:hypothetical protein